MGVKDDKPTTKTLEKRYELMSIAGMGESIFLMLLKKIRVDGFNQRISDNTNQTKLVFPVGSRKEPNPKPSSHAMNHNTTIPKLLFSRLLSDDKSDELSSSSRLFNEAK